jgi:hypothetical protein
VSGSDALHALQRLEPALRLARLGGLGAKTVDEGLHVRDLALLLAIRGFLLTQLRARASSKSL